MQTKIKTRKYAIVDLEATGAGSEAKIIQVGIVMVENGEITTRFATDVNPHEPLTQHIKLLTGITDKQLKKAPDFSQVARQIYDLLEDAVFVAHNVKFDANLLAEALFFEGFDLLTPRVDTVELAQIFFPTFEKYGLAQLTELLEIPLTQAHTAMADADATAQLFIKIQEKIASLPKVTLASILTFADSLLFESHLVIQEIYDQMSERLADDWQLVEGLVLKKQRIYRTSRHLSDNFSHNIALLDLEERKSQRKFADLIEKACLEKEMSFIEAPAGLGKTYGYLLPLLAQNPVLPIVVVVPTKLLQDQIMANEASKIAEVFHINCHSLKGPENYIKLDSFWLTLSRLDDNRLVNRFKMQLLVWLLETETGDLDEIKQQYRYQTYFDEIRHDGQLDVKSRFGVHDFWYQSYQRMQQSRVVVTNHAYLLHRTSDDSAFLKGKCVVIDEAQKLPLALEHFSRQRVDCLAQIQLVKDLLKQTTDLLQFRLLENIQFNLEKLISQLKKARNKTLSLDDVMSLRQDLTELNHPKLQTLTLCVSRRFDDFWFIRETIGDKQAIFLQAGTFDLLNFTPFVSQAEKVFLISATLQISHKVNLPQLLGVEDYQFETLKVENQPCQNVYLFQDLPAINSLTETDYADFITEKLLDLTVLDQPILVLFNANQLMLAVSDRLDTYDVSHLCQHKNGLASHLKKRFERGETKLLLGSGSFWEGVDFASQARVVEVITRLPFDNPADFFVKKVNQYVREKGGNAFYDYQLPLAILRLKQALGRTTRTQVQKSAVLILDNRVLTKKYGREIKQSLSEHATVISSKWENIIAELRTFLV